MFTGESDEFSVIINNGAHCTISLALTLPGAVYAGIDRSQRDYRAIFVTLHTTMASTAAAKMDPARHALVDAILDRTVSLCRSSGWYPPEARKDEIVEALCVRGARKPLTHEVFLRLTTHRLSADTAEEKDVSDTGWVKLNCVMARGTLAPHPNNKCLSKKMPCAQGSSAEDCKDFCSRIDRQAVSTE